MKSKNRTHHERKYVYDVSNFLLKFLRSFFKKRLASYYLLTLSIATAKVYSIPIISKVDGSFRFCGR